MIVKIMMNRPCKCMPDIAQHLIDTLLFGWTQCSIASLMGNKVDSDLMEGITKELVISLIGKEDLVSISDNCQ
jgi:hypothetical protein